MADQTLPVQVTTPYGGSNTAGVNQGFRPRIDQVVPPRGPPGTIVFIFGENFLPPGGQVFLVTFNGFGAVFDVISDGIIEAKVPPQPPGPSKVVVQVFTAFPATNPEIVFHSLKPGFFTYTQVFTTFDPGTAIAVTLSADKLQAINQLGGGGLIKNPAGVQSFAPQSSGKYYFEITWTSTVATNGGVGFASSGATYSTYVFDSVSSAGVGGAIALTAFPGEIWLNGSYTGNFISASDFGFVNGDVVGVAVDLDNLLFWMQTVGGPSFVPPGQEINGAWGGWNGTNSGTGLPANGDPASQTGGFIIPENLLPVLPTVAFAFNHNPGDEVFTANFGGTAFSLGLAPAGFRFWPAK